MVRGAQLAGDPGDDGGGARAGAAALAGGDEDHVRALQGLADVVLVVLGGPYCMDSGYPRGSSA